MEAKMRMYDFTEVIVEVEFEDFRPVNVSKCVANAVHANTADIGVDEIAREIYKSGKAEIEDGTMKEMFIAALENSPTLPIAIKQAVVKMMG